jgi:uncharacterized protein YdhG (YjbR/CyaY superfamily)
MKAKVAETINDVDRYIETFPAATQKLLSQLRKIIKQAAPEAEEVISYKMPAYKFNGMLVYFAGYKNHIGFYPTGSGIEAFKDEFKEYKWSKGAVQFPLDKPLPTELITRIVQYRSKQNSEKAYGKKK